MGQIFHRLINKHFFLLFFLAVILIGVKRDVFAQWHYSYCTLCKGLARSLGLQTEFIGCHCLQIGISVNKEESTSVLM